MSRVVRAALLCGIVLLVTSSPARADWQLAPFFGFSFKPDTNIAIAGVPGALKTRWNFGATGTLIGAGPLGVEGLFVYTPHFLESEAASALSGYTYALMGNAVLATPLHWNEYGLRPFVSGGLGLMHVTQRTTPSVFTLSRNLVGYNVGGGAIGFITDRTGLRFDLRYYSSLSRTQDTISIGPVRLRYWTGAVGVVFKF